MNENIAITQKIRKIEKYFKKYRSGRGLGENPLTALTPGESLTPLADLEYLAPNSVQFQTFALSLYS